jgi:hypothetical protein
MWLLKITNWHVKFTASTIWVLCQFTQKSKSSDLLVIEKLGEVTTKMYREPTFFTCSTQANQHEPAETKFKRAVGPIDQQIHEQIEHRRREYNLQI